MIAKMRKVYIAARQEDRDALLTALGALGVMHIVPVDPGLAAPGEKTQANLDALGRAIQLLSEIEPSGTGVSPVTSRATHGQDAHAANAVAAARETLDIQRRSAEMSARLTNLYRQISEMQIWGDVTLDQFARLRDMGIEPVFAVVPTDDVSAVRADLVERIADAPNGVLIAAISRGEQQPVLPESAKPLDLPPRDRPTIRAEAAEIDRQLRADQQRLRELANLRDAMNVERDRLADQAQFAIASGSGLHADTLYAVQGWVPADHADDLAKALATRGLSAGVEVRETGDLGQQPPTLVRYPTWAKPIQALFKILGTVPGYEEYDLSPFFMLSMPIFTAMLVGDAGYGLIFIIIGLLTYGRLARAKQVAAAQLVLVFAIATFIWGVLTGNAFGVGPDQLTAVGGFAATLGSAWAAVAVLWRSNPEAARDIVMQISFGIGFVHLAMAHIRQAIALLPDQRGIAEVGWVGFVFGMFTLVWFMFFKDKPAGALIPPMATLWIIVASWSVIVLFCNPVRNPIKRIGFGVLGNLMSIPGAFGDMLSYIRLMAVGLASYYIASAFNDLAMQMTEASIWALPATILVLALAHALNIGLCLVAIFAHGVRLNMLEFSTNAGVQWVGYPYAPFAVRLSPDEGDT